MSGAEFSQWSQTSERKLIICDRCGQPGWGSLKLYHAGNMGWECDPCQGDGKPGIAAKRNAEMREEQQRRNDAARLKKRDRAIRHKLSLYDD